MTFGLVRSIDRCGPTEEEIHREHRAALEATLFPARASESEVIFELDRGLLFFRDGEL